MGGQPFPHGPRQDDFHVGFAEGAAIIEIQTAVPEGQPLVWTVYDTTPEQRVVCSYPGVSEGGRVRSAFPRRWAYALANGSMIVRTRAAAAPAA